MKVGESETLNIDYHTEQLMIKALNTSKTQRQAADKLGMPMTTFQNHKWRFNLYKVDGVWQEGKEKIKK